MNRRLRQRPRRRGLAVAALAARGHGRRIGPTRHFTPPGRSSKIDPQIGPGRCWPNKPRSPSWSSSAARRPTRPRACQGPAAAATAQVLSPAQDKLEARHQGAGGKVLGQYQYAYNGIKVRIAGPARRARRDARRDGDPRRPDLQARQRQERAVHRRAVGVDGPRRDRRRARRSPSSTPASTTPTPTSAAPGTVAAYDANNPTIIEPGSFPTAKVVGGYDFAGNGYDADGDDGSPTPTPDPDPLDCDGHGSHVAGTAAGDGVLANGTTYPGRTTRRSHAATSSRSARASRPRRKLVALKVFGCEGSTDLVGRRPRLGRRVQRARTPTRIDVVNMSLGAPFGRNDDPDAVATNNLVAAGVVVVASAGNDGRRAVHHGRAGGGDQGDLGRRRWTPSPAFPAAAVDFADRARHHQRNNQNAFPGPAGQRHAQGDPQRRPAASASAARPPTTGRCQREHDRRDPARRLRRSSTREPPPPRPGPSGSSTSTATTSPSGRAADVHRVQPRAVRHPDGRRRTRLRRPAMLAADGRR